jgi:hypothetical protein
MALPGETSFSHRNPHGWAPVACHSAHDSSALVAVSSSARHRKIPHSNLTTLDHPVQSVDNSRKTLLSPLNPHLQLQRPQMAVGAADFLACPLSDVVLVSSSLTDPTACQKSSARVLAILKPDVPSDDELRTFISGYKNTSLSSLKPLSLHGMHIISSSKLWENTPRHDTNFGWNTSRPSAPNTFCFLHAISSSRVIFERDFLTFFPWDGWMGLDRMGIKALELEICKPC